MKQQILDDNIDDLEMRMLSMAVNHKRDCKDKFCGWCAMIDKAFNEFGVDVEEVYDYIASSERYP